MSERILMAIAGLAAHAHGHVRVNGRTLLDTANGIDLPTRARRIPRRRMRPPAPAPGRARG